MNTDKVIDMQIAVCNAPSGNGFRVEHMPALLESTTFDNCSPHVHYFYEILWFHEGDGVHTVDFSEYKVTPNTIFFLSPGQVHHFDHSSNYKGISIKMCTDFLKNDEAASSLFLKYSVFHTFDTTPCFHIDSETAQDLAKLVDEMEAESHNFDLFGNIDVLKALLRIFLVKIQRYGTQESDVHLDNLKPSHMLFTRFRKLVENRYKQFHTVQEYADELNVAVRTLNKCVNECSRMSPLAFINERILLEAKRMVRYTNLMIKEIAFELGYDDPSYFVKLFKRRWYALVKSIKHGNHFTLAFDRIKSISLTTDKFTLDSEFDAANWFKECYGIVRDD